MFVPPRFRRAAALCAVIPILAACATTKVTHHKMNDKDHKAEEADARGIRYYENVPFILVHAVPGGYKSETIYLPDTSTIHSARPIQFLASNSVNLTLKDGVLTQAESTVDATEVPKAVIAAAKAYATSGISLATEETLGELTLLKSAGESEKLGTMSFAPNKSVEKVAYVKAIAVPQCKLDEPVVDPAGEFDGRPRVYLFRYGIERDDSGNATPFLYSGDVKIPLYPNHYMTYTGAVSASKG